MASFFLSKKNNYATEASFETKPFRLHKLDSGPSNQVTITRDDAIDIFKKLHLIRRMETAAGNLYKEKIVRGFCHLYSGQVKILALFAYPLSFTRCVKLILILCIYISPTGSLRGWYEGRDETPGRRDYGLPRARLDVFDGHRTVGCVRGTHRQTERQCKGQGRFDAHVLAEFLRWERHSRRSGRY